MTKKELELIKEFLERVPGCFTEKQRETCSICAQLDVAKEAVNREIKLKTMDPRKQED